MSVIQIDYSETYRYRCTECNSVQTKRRVSAKDHDRPVVPAYYCRNCQTELTELYDGKKETVITVGTIGEDHDEPIRRDGYIGADPYPGATPEHER